jgi:hypothetical protein
MNYYGLTFYKIIKQKPVFHEQCKDGSRSKVVGNDLISELCVSNFIDVIRPLISDS